MGVSPSSQQGGDCETLVPRVRWTEEMYDKRIESFRRWWFLRGRATTDALVRDEWYMRLMHTELEDEGSSYHKCARAIRDAELSGRHQATCDVSSTPNGIVLSAMLRPNTAFADHIKLEEREKAETGLPGTIRLVMLSSTCATFSWETAAE